ncbi:hypothetical protein C8R45DRAFT_1139861 [Mycena sanguinolenta]|nr:hypothetical protein C8R45DRAFT_1139861 [Mycena sanguinolenta]
MSAHLRKRLEELNTQIIEQRHVLEQLQQIRSNRLSHRSFSIASHFFEPWSIPNFKGPSVIALTVVCRVWRDVALSTPTLWAKLELQFDRIDGRITRNLGFLESFIDRWLARAGNCPLSLDFECRRAVFDLPRLGDIVRRWSHRVQHLRLTLGPHPDLSPLGLDSAAFPLLQSATLKFDAEPKVTPIIVFRDAPHLRHLHLQSSAVAPSTFSFAWSQLTEFEGTIWDLELFILAPNLTRVACSFAPEDDDFTAVTHYTLKSLTIYEYSSDVIQYLTLPSLQSLDVSSHTEIYLSLEAFLKRSSPPLIFLSATGIDSDSRESYLRCWAKFTPLIADTLESLQFDDVSTQDMISIFGLLKDHTFLSLRTLTFTDVDGPSDLHLLVDFLYRRVDTLRTFKVTWISSPFLDDTAFAGVSGFGRTDTIRNHLSLLQQRGMDIHLGTPEKNYASFSDV